MGVSYMAEDSLPGEALYAVKIRVNDGIRHVTAIRSETEALVSAEVIARRTQEARRLAAEGRLDIEAKSRLSEEIQAELKKWNKATSGWVTEGSSSSQTEARLKFDSQAEANADIFQLLGISLKPSLLSGQGDSSSESVYLKGSPGDLETSSTQENDTMDTVMNEYASTSLDARKVINTR
jgi:hypothetical protein